MSINKLNNFDKLLKSKLDQHSIPFNEGDWNALEKKLPKQSPTPFYKNPWLWSGAAVVTLIISSFILFDSTKTITNENTPSVSSEKNNTNLSNIKAEDGSTQQNITSKNQVNENKSIPHKNEDNDNGSDNSKTNINQDTETLNIDNTETTASKNNETKTTDNANNTFVDSSLSPSVAPEEFNTIIEVKKPEAFIICKNTEMCAGQTFTFETASQKDVDYLWSFGDETFSKEQNPKHKFPSSGSYKVGLIVRSKIDNAVLTKAKDILINVLETPNVDFETEETINMGIPSLSFINMTEKANQWSWNLGDGNISNEKDPYHNYRRKGYYNVSLTATNKEGCTATASKKVYIENDYNLLAPNSFTPNGDGINDYFIPEALKIMDSEFSMSIFSQSEGLLFETKNINQQWDGINQQTGEKCNAGNYIWVVTLTNNQGQTEQYKGAVLILE